MFVSKMLYTTIGWSVRSPNVPMPSPSLCDIYESKKGSPLLLFAIGLHFYTVRYRLGFLRPASFQISTTVECAADRNE